MAMTVGVSSFYTDRAYPDQLPRSAASYFAPAGSQRMRKVSDTVTLSVDASNTTGRDSDFTNTSFFRMIDIPSGARVNGMWADSNGGWAAGTIASIGLALKPVGNNLSPRLLPFTGSDLFFGVSLNLMNTVTNREDMLYVDPTSSDTYSTDKGDALWRVINKQRVRNSAAELYSKDPGITFQVILTIQVGGAIDPLGDGTPSMVRLEIETLES